MTEATVRTVSVNPGLLSPEELLKRHKGGRRKTLEALIARSVSSLGLNIKTRNQIYQEKARWFLDDARVKFSYDDFMTVATIFVLFGDWVLTLAFPPSVDHTFHSLYNVAFFLFIMELILNSWSKSDYSNGFFKAKGYIFRFFFWLDLICIISMIPDLEWAASWFGLEDLSSGVGTKAGKAGKIGAKTGRVVRMMRLLRIVKLYKITSQKKRERKLMEDLNSLVEQGHIDQEDIDAYVERMNSSSKKQSKVGAELSDKITRRVIVSVLVMLLVVPILTYSASSAQDELQAAQFLQSININAGSGPETDCDFLTRSVEDYTGFMESIVDSTDNDHSYLLEYQITPDRCGANTLQPQGLMLENFRKKELREINLSWISTDGVTFSVDAIYNQKYFMEQDAIASIYLTIFVVFMLVTLSTQFTGDAQKLVLAPIESMMAMVNMVANDPLEAFDFKDISQQFGDYEMHVVQVAIQKIIALLRIGFGVAGAEIISTHMAVEGAGGSAVLDPLISGKRVYAIFGFCDIYAFDHCIERLEDEIMTFVNTIAKIVHDEVTRWDGECNKNLGNAFLIVWRIGDEEELRGITGKRRRKSMLTSQRNTPISSRDATHLRNATSTVHLKRIPGIDIVADKALVGFLKVLVEVNRNLKVLAYRHDKRLIGKSGVFNLRMGFGLNAGWAIEGAVGSLQKVDATYLSPHVNMAARMEAAAKQFGVAVLMTELFVELMSNEAQSHCRKLDVVTVKGSDVPMPIYTYDTLQNQTFPPLTVPKFTGLDLEQVLAQQAEQYDCGAWKSDEDLIQLRCLATPIFSETYRLGLEHYLSGDWVKARDYFEQADVMMTDGDTGGDGPSRTLLSYMESREWKRPTDWKGFRPLTSK